MKKIFTAASVCLAVLLVAAVSSAVKPTIDPGVMEFEGALKSANVDVRGDIDGTQQRLHFVAKNKGRATNATVVFDNISGWTSGIVQFGNEGLYVTFEGPVNFPNFNRAAGSVPCEGAILVDGNLVYDPATGAVTGTDGSLVQFDGSMNLRAVIKSGGARATMKGKISASNANLVVFGNSSTVSTTPVDLRVKLPAIQLKAKTNGNGNGN